MDIPFVGELPKGLKQCTVCKEPINEQATRCIHCDSEQDFWRRRLGFSSTVLSLMVALVTVLTAAIPVVKNAFTTQDSNIGVSFQAANDHEISIKASNAGIRAGSIHSPHITIVNPGGVNLNVELTFEHSPPSILIDPGQTQLVLITGKQSKLKSTDIHSDAVCALQINYTSISNKLENMNSEVACQQVEGFLTK